MHKSFLQNAAGRDYTVGENHGCFNRLSFDVWLCHRAGVVNAAEAIGFEAWMRERTEAAHRAMMRHAGRGGQGHGV